ncbi:unnamed protein product (macronuclear) [Paramecium tetraurelia]|uniref:Transmembrane protein n=1 Tax=Paramecium tetraurelia TaxID=5888 RepID=A0EA86_PARTE|nr:uncharacterized protein GSPATT00024935001 [Paramecium tetraurelia]CAK92203.1 unnamed protein product [Paramecium tetraurelia]|eukprot:XP_001459600.1 hypothetical protein (macronuclear) [Paramecium tetraurelia strain d4-2]
MGKDIKWQNTREVPNSWLSYPVQQFRLKISQDMILKDIFVFLTQLNDTRTNTQLYFSETELESIQIPQVTDCKNFGLDNLCQFNAFESKTYYFLVYCKVNCHYQINVQTQNHHEYLSNENMIKSITSEEGKPLCLNLTNIEYERVSLLIIQITTYNIMSLYINMNETIPTAQEFDVQYDIDKQLIIFCWNNQTHPQNVISTLFKGLGSFYIELKIYQSIHRISLYQKIEDKVKKDKVNYYKLIVEDLQDHLLMFNVDYKSQNIKIYVQPCIGDRCSINYTNFEWQFQFDIEYQQFIIPFHKMIYTNEYLIAINTDFNFSQYQFEVKINHNLREALVIRNVYQGILSKNQIALFLLDYMIQEGVEIVIQLIFKYSKGHGVILSKQCIKDEEELKIIDDEFDYLQQADPDNYYNCSFTQEQASLISSDHIQAENEIKFFFNQSEIQQDVPKLSFESRSFNFHYMVAVQSYVDSMRFSLQIKYKSEFTRTNLDQYLINYKALAQLNVEKYEFYSFNLPEQIVSICIAIYYGEQQIQNKIYVSRVNPELKLMKTLDFEVIQYKADVCHSFKMDILAQANLRFSILEIFNSRSNSPFKSIPLHLATPFKTLDLNHQMTFEIIEEATLYINLKSLYGNFICYILSNSRNFGNSFPNKYNFTLTSDQHTLIIENPQQFNFLYVKSTSLQEDESYQILYYYHNSFLELFLASTFYGLLNDNKTLYFYYQSFSNPSRLYIIRTYLSEYNDQNNLQIYISLNNKCPDQVNFEYQILPTSNYIPIHNFSSGSMIYIGVYSKGTNKYSLLIQEEHSGIELKDNIIQTSPALEQQNYYFYYFIPKNFNFSTPVKIQAFTKFNLIELSCNVVEFDFKHPQRQQYPTNQKYEIKELFSSNPSNKMLFINTTDMVMCKKNGCLLLITAYVLGHYDYFNIMVSSKYTVIRNLEMIIGYASQNVMSYYYFDIDEHIKEIQISTTAIQDCDYDVYVLKSRNNTQFLYPSVDQYTYKFASDTLIISEEDNRGHYVIGVLAQDCIFEILLHLGGFQLNYIHNGQIVDTHIESTISYYYLNHHEEPFRILIYDMKNIKVSISVENNSKQIEVPNSDELFGGVIQIQEDICQSCTYIFTLHPIRPTAVSLILSYNSIPLPIKYGRTYYDHCLNKCEFNLQPGELYLFIYSKSIQLTFHSKINQITRMDLTYSNHIIPINETCILRIYTDSYYSINLSNREFPITLQLGREFNGRNTIDHNQQVFIFSIERIDQEYIIQISSRSEVMVQVYYDTGTKMILPKQEYRINKSKHTLIYQFQEIEKQYSITLQCVGDYYITVNVYNKIKYINFNNHYIEIIEEGQQYNIQAILEQELQFEKIDCLGKTQLQKTSSSRDTLFKIQAVDQTQPFKFNILSLVPHIQYSHDQWYLKNARFEITKLLNDSLEINIHTMRRKKTGSLNLKNLIYKMHLSDQDFLMRALGCEIDIEFLQNYTGSSIFYNTFIQEVKENQESLQFTVSINRELIYGLLVFQAYYENYSIPYTYFYDVSVIYNESEKMKVEVEIEDSRINYILIVFVISVLLAFGLFCLWVCMPKQRQRSREFHEQQEEQESYGQYELSKLKQKEPVNTT